MKTDLLQSCGHCWVFQICWQIECSTFTASSFRIWNSSTGIPSPPLALFVVILSKAHLTSHSRMSGRALRKIILEDYFGGIDHIICKAWKPGLRLPWERKKFYLGHYPQLYKPNLCMCVHVCVCMCVNVCVYVLSTYISNPTGSVSVVESWLICVCLCPCLDTTEQLYFHFSLSCIGEGNGNPLQCSCLENPRDDRAWWAAVYGVTQSRTRLKWLSIA